MKELRSGYTTGSAMTAAAVAAWRGSSEKVTVHLPDGGTLAIPVARLRSGGATVVKDSGDDPDTTNGCEIEVELKVPENKYFPCFREPCGSGMLLIYGGAGVGRVTRPGLAVPVGFPAINPGPRRILADNLERAGFGETPGEELALTVSVPGGEELAKKTLNPTLGVTGGISILGRSGIVRPYSHEAYAETIRLQLNSVAAIGGRAAALTTGNRTTEAVRRDFPELPETAVVPIADFIHVAVRAAADAKLERLAVGCMPGKLFKYACGLENTHAHRNRQELSRLTEFGTEPGDAVSMGEIAARLEPGEYRTLLDRLHRRALEILQEWAGEEMKIELAVYDNEGGRIR